ncbi:CRISPR-associated helicase Cas3' [Geobacillus stearothermophilus]|uniref:CRISPR-associated helicase Cas3 n=1 Tax=Geobacillus stearothermophilus TaxID=1422 RepID=A0A3L7DBA6_GEOSE|nr:CRISPR-associated helicase Cas3' [Geobacillus stearothermophilus]RLQ07151.1 CRISPR-associated helicase Cas3' [Geobacillus stearothermophilus]RLQ08522.1 CRISPR-associated helicase Cas3' [Geobacillus stearothermophilus]RLQ13503.1 CRISPR-associated helicase Cas3' [Geobacillus stearothermophilus]
MYSHPHYLLSEHLRGVEQLSSLFLSEKSIRLADPVLLGKMNRWIALFHDLGKGHAFFQQYIQSPDAFQGPPALKSHALLSAVLLAMFLKEKGIDEFGRLLAFLVVKRHHGNLDDWLEELKRMGEETKALLRRQVEAVDYAALAEQMALAGLGKEGIWTKETWSAWLDEFFTEARSLRRFIMSWNRENKSLAPYVRVLFLFSLLIDADKSEAGIVQKQSWSFSARKEIPADLILRYKQRQSWETTALNQLRERAFREVDETPIDLSQHFYRLNLPTGMGKTLASLHFALRLRETIERQQGIKPRIIYTLPFLSVIDQTANVLKEIFSCNGVGEDHQLWLAHHHLADIRYTTKQDDERYDADYEAAKLLIEGWHSELIVTTFVQLFETIFSNRNASLRKFHRLANSIILIDEVQAVPHRYWLAIRQLFEAMAEELGCYFLFSSATDPKWFPKAISLVNEQAYFQPLSRVALYPDIDKPMTIEEFVRRIEWDEEKTYLFILNTIESAKTFYKTLLDEGIDEAEVAFLSTHIPPKERLRRVKAAKNGEYRIVVSTQLIEAGVDIDFDVVYRDFAPLDSIQQAAGRCNRHGHRTGEVHVVRLTDNRRLYASYIYDAIRLDITQTLLKGNKEVHEGQFLRLITSYFETLAARMSNAESERLLKGMMTLYFDGEETIDRIPVSHFRLIEGDGEKMNVFIELDEEAVDVFREYEAILRLHDRWERRKRFASLKSRFSQYVIAIPAKVDHQPPIVHGIGYVGRDSLNDFYDEKLGYRTKSEGLIW